MSTFRRKLTFCRTGSKSPLTGRIGSRLSRKADEAGWPPGLDGWPALTASMEKMTCQRLGTKIPFEHLRRKVSFRSWSDLD